MMRDETDRFPATVAETTTAGATISALSLIS
jgi:hypothetical protein